MAHACNPSFSGDRNEKNHRSRAAQAKGNRDHIWKILNTKKTGRVAQVVEGLPSKLEAPSTTKNKQKILHHNLLQFPFSSQTGLLLHSLSITTKKKATEKVRNPSTTNRYKTSFPNNQNKG
jgi:hypothetical protein